VIVVRKWFGDYAIDVSELTTRSLAQGSHARTLSTPRNTKQPPSSSWTATDEHDHFSLNRDNRSSLNRDEDIAVNY
jgi:hypothetical protein